VTNMSRKLWPLAALALVALISLIGAGCSNGSAENGNASGGNKNTGDREKAMKFAECMRNNGVREFPDPGASGGLTIDGVLNGSSLDPSTPAWKAAIAACKDLQPPGFMGDQEVSAAEKKARLEFAQCVRDNGVKDFPDPANDEPLVDTNRIPSATTEGGMSILNAAMRRCRDFAAAAGATGGQ
jgi:hypothetical protein